MNPSAHSTSTPPTSTPAAQLLALGARIRARRKALRISAVDVAQACAMSRVTLHRVERGEATVAMASYMSAIHALGLELTVKDAASGKHAVLVRAESPQRPETLRLADYAQLQSLAWHVNLGTDITPAMALNLYERHWRHLDHAAMSPKEQALIARLAHDLPGGRLLV
jgi:transcriptional regulator with XRE-family HTH domain